MGAIPYHVRLKIVKDGEPFTFINKEFEGICYQRNNVIYCWLTGQTLGVCTGIRDENPIVKLELNPPQPIR
jgi:hypothetical protein